MRLRPPRHARAVPRVRYNPSTVKRLARILLHALTVLSLLLFVAIIVVWVRSYWVTDGWYYTAQRRISGRTEETTRAVRLDAGRLHLLFSRLLYDDVWMASLGFPRIRPTSRFWHSSGEPQVLAQIPGGPDLVVIRRILGFEYGVTNPTPRTRDLLQSRWVAVPLWLLALCTVWLPLLRWRKWRRVGRARAQRHCIACGYDLRATPERCPECGAAAAAAG